MRAPLKRFRLSIGLAILTTVVAVFAYLVFHLPVANMPARYAGGSATGNAISLAAAKPQWVGVQLALHDTVVNISAPEPVVANLAKPQKPTPTLAVIDSMPSDADSALKAWLAVRRITYKRLLHFAPGNSFLDSSIIPGGLQPGDLVVYGSGSYAQMHQTPNPEFQGSADAPLTLLAWPLGSARLQVPHGIHLHNATYWHWVGLELQASPNDAQVMLLQNTRGIDVEQCTFDSLLQGSGLEGTSNAELTLAGNHFEPFAHAVVLNEDSSSAQNLGMVRIEANHLDNGSMVMTLLKLDSLRIENNVVRSDDAAMQLKMVTGLVQLRNNVVIGAGRGCLLLQGINAIIEKNSLWNRHASTAKVEDLVQIIPAQGQQEFRFVSNKMLDEAGAIMSKPNASTTFKDNQLYTHGNPVPAWLAISNQIADPGFAAAP